MKIVVDFDKCKSNAVCMAVAPEVFEVRDDNFLYILQEEPRRGAAARRSKRPSARVPTGAISVEADVRWNTIVVVGASLAGLRAVEALRREGYAGRLTLVGAEPHLPYDRPPLSKEFLAGHVRARPARAAPAGPRRARPRPATRRARAHARRRRARTLGVGAGELAFDGLVIATGAHPRPLPGPARARRRLHCCARSTTAIALRRRSSTTGARLCVIGAGFIGAEVAATCRGRGPRRHRARGAAPADGARARAGARRGARRACTATTASTCALGVGVDAIEGDGRVERVAARRRIESSSATSVLVAIGAVPDHRLARGLRAHARQRRGVRRDAARRAGHRRRRRRVPVAEPDVRRRGHAPRALDQRGRAGRARGADASGR